MAAASGLLLVGVGCSDGGGGKAKTPLDVLEQMDSCDEGELPSYNDQFEIECYPVSTFSSGESFIPGG